MKKTNVTREYLLGVGAVELCSTRKFDGACLMPSRLWQLPDGSAFHLVVYSTPETAPNAWLHNRLFASSRMFAPLPAAPLPESAGPLFE